MASALRMLEEKEYKDITVLELVADSAVNRNTFYYHFKDMPSLMLELVKRGLDRGLASCKGTAEEKLICLVELLHKNRVSAMHIYSSADRVLFDEGFAAVCEYLAERIHSVLNTAQPDAAAEKACCLFMKSSFYGLGCDWFSKGLDEAELDNIREICVRIVKCINE